MNNYCEKCGKELVNDECHNCNPIEKRVEKKEDIKSFKRKIIIDTIKKLLLIIFVCFIIYVIFALIMGLLAMQACADFVNAMG